MYTTYKTSLLQAKANRIIRAHMAKILSAYDLSLPEWTIIGQVYERGNGIRLAEISDILSVEAPLITTLTDQLVHKELVNRTDDPQDRRAKLISLSDKGRELVPKVEKVAREELLKLLHDISPEDLSAYNRVLEKIVSMPNPSES